MCKGIFNFFSRAWGVRGKGDALPPSRSPTHPAHVWPPAPGSPAEQGSPEMFYLFWSLYAGQFDWGVYKGIFNVFLVVLEGPGPPAGPPGPPGMIFPPKAPMGLGQIDDPPVLAPIPDIRLHQVSY